MNQTQERLGRGRPQALLGAPGRNAFTGGVIGVVVLLILWALFSRTQPEIILPSPAETWRAFAHLWSGGTLLRELGLTLYRAASGVLIGLAIGSIWGAINGLFNWVSNVTRPVVSALMAIPPIVLVSLGLIWLGPGGAVARLVIVLVALPLIIVTVEEAVRNLDQRLIEMATVFQVSRARRFRHVIAPGIASPVLAATTVVFGQSLRVAIMAELLSTVTGIGAQISLAQTNLDTAKIFAWTITVIIVVIALETAVLKPFNSRLLRWRGTGGTETRGAGH